MVILEFEVAISEAYFLSYNKKFSGRTYHNDLQKLYVDKKGFMFWKDGLVHRIYGPATFHPPHEFQEKTTKGWWVLGTCYGVFDSEEKIFLRKYNHKIFKKDLILKWLC